MWDEIKSTLEKKFSFTFNRNQWRDIKRLIYEISVRNGCTPQKVISNLPRIKKIINAQGRDTFFVLKKSLVSLRFPLTSKLYAIDTKKLFLTDFKEPFPDNYRPRAEFMPQKVFIEKDARGSYLIKRFKDKFPGAEYEELSSYTQYVKNHKFTHAELKKPIVFIVKEKWDFIKPCPCTKYVLGCGYWIFNLGFGCPFDCSYCFLQQYSNIQGIILPSNLDDFFNKFDTFYQKLKNPIRIGTGEFCDSLALDDITCYATQLVEYFRDKNLYFELKTKSANIGNLLNTPASYNIVVSWSLTPPGLIHSEELATSSFKERVEAASRAQKKGFSLAFHFDPVIYSHEWENEYRRVIDYLYAQLSPPFKWISLGTLRANRELKPIVEQRFPESTIFYGELLLGRDKKMRYPKFLRIEMYKKMMRWIRSYDSRTPIYLCMESEDVWKACGYSFSSPQEIERYLLDT